MVVEDGLSSSAPHITDLKDNKMHFMLGAKPGDHRYLFEDLSLNKSNLDVRVKFLQHHEFDGESFATLKCFSWVTDLDLGEKDLELWFFGEQ